MVECRLKDLVPTTGGRSDLIFDVKATAEEIDGAARVVPALLVALGPLNVSVLNGERIGRIAAGVARLVEGRLSGARLAAEVLALIEEVT